MTRVKLPWLIAGCLVLGAAIAPARAQKLYDDHEMKDRFYVTIGGFSQDDIRTTLRVDARTPAGGLAAGAVVAVESLFSVDDQVSTGRLDGWYRLNRKSRLSWTYWKTSRDGRSVYDRDEDITIGEIVISEGDSVAVDSDSTLFAIGYSYSFVNLAKFEAWLGGGFNVQRADVGVVVDVGGQAIETLKEDAKATVPIPTINFGMRYNFSERLRALIQQQLFGLRVGDYSGRLNNTRLLAEYALTRHFGIGGGIERYNLEIDVETDDFLGSLDNSYTGLSIYLKGQL